MNPGEQFKLVRRLLKEQDQVLEQLDELNARIEETLRAISPKTDESALSPVPADSDVQTSRAA